jgi:hypothetical protein
MEKKRASLAVFLSLFVLGVFANGAATPDTPKKTATTRHATSHKKHKVYQKEIKFKSETKRGQVLSAGEQPPPTTLRDSAQSK